MLSKIQLSSGTLVSWFLLEGFPVQSSNQKKMPFVSHGYWAFEKMPTSFSCTTFEQKKQGSLCSMKPHRANVEVSFGLLNPWLLFRPLARLGNDWSCRTEAPTNGPPKEMLLSDPIPADQRVLPDLLVERRVDLPRSRRIKWDSREHRLVPPFF